MTGRQHADGSVLPVVLGGSPVRPFSAFPLEVGPLPHLVQDLSLPPGAWEQAAAGLPPGPALPEAVAVRWRRSGRLLSVKPNGSSGSPLPQLVSAERARGASSVEMWRADPSLVTELQLGGWTNARTGARLLRRLLMPAVGGVARVVEKAQPGRASGESTLHRALVDAAFWSGARRRTSRPEWHVLTRSYVAFCYHRVAGEHLAGQERLDLAPSAYRAQLRLLRALRWRPLPAEDLLTLHQGRPVRVPRRSYVVTLDDGFADAVDAALGSRSHRPHVYVPTARLGVPAEWAQGSMTADWDTVRQARTGGVVVGGHGRRHVALPGLVGAELQDEVAGSFADLHSELDGPTPFLAYPYGRHDTAVREAARAAGYRLAWTTRVGRNGSGTDPWCLRRVGVEDYDSLPAFLWKAITGELLPAPWERRLLRRHERRTGRRVKATPERSTSPSQATREDTT